MIKHLRKAIFCSLEEMREISLDSFHNFLKWNFEKKLRTELFFFENIFWRTGFGMKGHSKSGKKTLKVFKVGFDVADSLRTQERDYILEVLNEIKLFVKSNWRN